MGDWLPISEAPKDGSRVELKRQTGFTICAQWLNLPSIFRNGPQWWSSEFGMPLVLVDVPLDPVTHFRVPADT